ncbi:MAG TPA: FAD-dependent oxidoreductase [Trueperaceae bacterium]|nr:FAD-dependent oxidoreductase [Trueperaceae bacterium]
MSVQLPSGAVDVLVVGGGIAGATLAYCLAREGVGVLLVDEGGTRAGGASSVPAALLNPNRGRSGGASAAGLAGLAGFWSLTSELEGGGHETGARRTGVLRVADNARQARGWQRLEGTTWLEPSEVPAAYHAPHGAMLVGRGGWVRPGKLLGALETATAARGGVTLRGVRAGGLTANAHGVTVDTSSGPLRAREVVLCLGAQRPPGFRLPEFETVWGEARVLGAAVDAPYPVAGSVVAAFGTDEVYVSGGHTAVPAEPGARLDDDLRRALSWHVPAVAAAPTLTRWVGARAKRPSGEPVARRLTRGVLMFGALGGRGFLRAATVAEAMASRLRKELLG